MIPIDPVDIDGLPPGRNCPACGEPLEPGHIDDSLQLVWLCPSHGVVDRTIDPLRGL
ncbi:hypothetical protein RR49_02532 [Microbacterium ginsengisoli]|uniref:Uncharacterized protein n=1 Tax=Microbacterium ginsengisoli TaxID=400772 RepID=A0A0F0LSQ8_9MICO|nr:hypothetical protein RR49_02532 [Microbacterium ginsengisoli]MEA5055275.1 hypothetical protein [Propionicimonas sp.]